jgi:hypothetical protein
MQRVTVREDGDGGDRQRVRGKNRQLLWARSARTRSGRWNESSSMLVSHEYHRFGNGVSSFHLDETFFFSLLPISCKKIIMFWCVTALMCMTLLWNANETSLMSLPPFSFIRHTRKKRFRLYNFWPKMYPSIFFCHVKFDMFGFVIKCTFRWV